MTISQEERLHGGAILTLLEAINAALPDVLCSIAPGDSRSAYLLTFCKSGSDKTHTVGLFIKHSSKRRSPWRYTFILAHQEEIHRLNEDYEDVFVILIAGEDGYACLDHDRLKEVLDHVFEESEWIRLSRKLRGTYRVSGTDGELERSLPRNVFPDAIIDRIRSTLY